VRGVVLVIAYICRRLRCSQQLGLPHLEEDRSATPHIKTSTSGQAESAARWL